MQIKIILLLLVVVAIIIYFLTGSPVTKNIDSYVYDLPYGPGTSHRVVQGYGGKFSHKNKAALDLAMPVGTAIYAARGGTLFSYKDDSDRGGPFPLYDGESNYIIIQHDDGSFGCYWHLKKNGVVTKTGKVVKGQLIGYSGRTGFVLRPHLHFTVKRKLNYKMDSFIRTKFSTSQGVQLLKSGRSYERPAS